MNIGATKIMLMNLYKKLNTNAQFNFISFYDKHIYYDDKIIKLVGVSYLNQLV